MTTYIHATDTVYQQDPQSGKVLDCFGKEMDGIDDILEELNFLMGELRKAKKNVEELEKSFL